MEGSNKCCDRSQGRRIEARGFDRSMRLFDPAQCSVRGPHFRRKLLIMQRYLLLASAFVAHGAVFAQGANLLGTNITLEYPGNGTAIPANVADGNGWFYVNGTGQNGFASPNVGYVKRQTCNGQPFNAAYSFASNVNYPGNCNATAQHGEVHGVFGGVPVGCHGNDKYIMMRGQGTNAASEMIGVVHKLDVPVLAGQTVVFRGWLGFKRGVPATLGTTNFTFYMALGNTTDPAITLPTPAANTTTLLTGTIPTTNCMTWVQPLASLVATQNFDRVIIYVRTSAPSGARNHFYLDDVFIASENPLLMPPSEGSGQMVRTERSIELDPDQGTHGELFVWPVPAREDAMVQLPWEDAVTGTLVMYDVTGRDVWSSSVTGPMISVPLSGVPPGSYVLNYTGEGRSAVARVQKE